MKLTFLILWIALLTLFAGFVANAQQYKLELPGVSVLKTSRKIFEKKYGSPFEKNPENRIFRYSTASQLIEVTFTSKPCSGGLRGAYNVKQDTVLYYSVFYRKPVVLSALDFDVQTFSKDETGDLLNALQYINSDRGITIRAYVSGGDNNTYVKGIDYYPSSRDELKLKCSLADK